METLEQYLERTESAVKILFSGIDSYIQILRDNRPPVFVYRQHGSGNPDNNEAIQQKLEDAYAKWHSKNEVAIQRSFKAQRQFSAESIALATLCGSVLQIASMGIQMFSSNEEVPSELPENLKDKLSCDKKAVKFCIGRKVKTLPIGLLVYAGRNQYNHMDEEKLRPLNKIIFDIAANNYEGATEDSPKYPALDLGNPSIINYSTNITGILDWRDYEAYYCDMHSLLVTDQ